MKRSYEETPNNNSKIYVNIFEATHYEPGKLGHNYWPDYLAAFFTCHLSSLSSSLSSASASAVSSSPTTTTTTQHPNIPDPQMSQKTQIIEACNRVYGNNIQTCDLCVCNERIPIESCKSNHINKD